MRRRYSEGPGPSRKPRVKPLDGLTPVGKVYDIAEGPLAGVQVIRLTYGWAARWQSHEPTLAGAHIAIRSSLEEQVGESLSAFGFAFCEAFRHRHLAVGVEYACGIDFQRGKTAYRWEDISCPECRNAGAVRLTMLPFTDKGA